MEHELKVAVSTITEIYLNDVFSWKERRQLRKLLPEGVKLEKPFTFGSFNFFTDCPGEDKIIISWKERGQENIMRKKVLDTVKKFLDERELMGTHLAV